MRPKSGWPASRARAQKRAGRYSGTVRWFNPKKRMGYIAPNQNQSQHQNVVFLTAGLNEGAGRTAMPRRRAPHRGLPDGVPPHAVWVAQATCPKPATT